MFTGGGVARVGVRETKRKRYVTMTGAARRDARGGEGDGRESRVVGGGGKTF